MLEKDEGGLSCLESYLVKSAVLPWLWMWASYMDTNTVYGMTVGWERGHVAGSQYSPWLFTHTHA